MWKFQCIGLKLGMKRICDIFAQCRLGSKCMMHMFTQTLFLMGSVKTTQDAAAWRPYKMTCFVCSHDSSIYKYLYKNMSLKLYTDF